MPQKDASELPEFVLSGPFGGIQSEVPPERTEKLGFRDVVNMLFRQGECRVRPKANALPLQPASLNPGLRIMDLVGEIQDQTWSPASLRLSTGLVEPWIGVADFFNKDGNRLQVAFTPTRMILWTGSATGSWSVIAGGLTGLASQKVSWAVVAEKLCFCQGVDKVQLWDGITSSFAEASADAVPAKYLFELDNHLIALNTVEAGGRAYQRVRWTGAGDPTDWVSANAGQNDRFNDLGPINGGIKLFQYGYIFQQKGITQVIPTGIGTNPFYFQPLSAASKGLVCPYSLAANGETTCYYVGKDNVYSFDGTSSEPVGDSPIGQGARRGARSRIFADLQGAEPNDVVGYVSTSINGNPYNAYWLVIPNVATWVYNIDEENWTRFTWQNRLAIIGTFAVKGPIRIKDLIGTISQQMWSPATLLNDNPFDSVFLGMADGSPFIFDFTGWSEQNWYVETGQLAMGDYRHEKTVKKMRMIYKDYGEVTILVQITNDRGQVWVPNFINVPDGFTTSTLLGDGTGLAREEMFMPSLSGMFYIVKIYGAPGQPFGFSELAPIYSVGGEQKYKGEAGLYHPTGQ